MTSTLRKLVAGNWKMHGVAASLREAQRVSDELKTHPAACRVALFPPAPLIHRMAEALARGPIEVGAQDCHAMSHGAYTGDYSADMLHDAGARLVILGHSERRAGHKESDREIADKVRAALAGGLEPIVCVGEDMNHRRDGQALAVVGRHLQDSLPDELEGRAFAVAYEPVWAIGSGETPSLAEIEEVHEVIGEVLQGRFTQGGRTPILYGGSVKPGNAREILGARGVGGVLVGGASLTADDFLPIVRAVNGSRQSAPAG